MPNILNFLQKITLYINIGLYKLFLGAITASKKEKKCRP